MSILLNDNLQNNSPKPLDAKYLNGVTPWATVAAANAGIPLTQRSIGLTVNIAGVEYWYKNGITDPDLIIKSGGGLTNPVCTLQMQKVVTPAVPNTLGPAIGFTHANNSGTIDVITAGVTEFFRDPTGGGIYNIAVETFFNPGISPTNTEWNSVYTDPLNNGHANIQNVTTRVYSDFTTALNGTIGAVILTTPLVMHDLVTNKYYLFTFTQWTSGGGGGGFAYTRTEVILGSPPVVVCDGRIKFDDGTWIDTAPVSTGMAIARYVYLVQDASDVTRMGGTAANAYNTFQAAYNAANALQLALGGTNVVAIIVGNTTAASVGNLVLTANYNQYVQIIGESMNTSFLGSITSTVAGVGISNLFLEGVRLTTINLNNGSVTLSGNNAGECFIQSIFTGGGSASVFSYKYAYINQINTIGASGVPSGNITATGNAYFFASALQLDAVAANVGSCQLNANKFVSVNFVTMNITGSTLGTETIGVFSMSGNLYGELPNGVTMNTNHLSPVATWGGIAINNVGRTSIGGININYNNTAGASASDLLINNLFFQRCDGFELGVNWQLNTLNPKGGYCTNLTMIDSIFSFRIRVGYRPSTAKTNLRVNFDRITMSSPIVGRDLVFYHNLCSFIQLQLINSFSDGSSGFSIQNTGTTSTQMTLTNQMIIRNNVTNALTIVSRNAGATSTVDDVVLNGNQIGSLYIEVAQGDMNFSMDQCTSKITRLVASGTATSIKRNIITNSDLNTTVGNITLQGGAPRPKLSLRNSYLNIYTTNASAGTIDIIAYASFLDTIADVGSVSTYVGNVYTTSVKRLVTDNVAGLTFNASFDQPV